MLAESVRAKLNPIIEIIPQRWRRPLGHFTIVFIFLLVGTLFYHAYEGWSPGTCLAFSVVTITTVGYGYHYPTDNASRVFTVFYMLFGIFFVFGGIADMINSSLQEFRQRQANRKVETEEAFKQLKRSMIFTALGIVALLFFGAFMFMALEGWDFVKAFYFAVETSTTVGYGDLAIEDNYGRIFLVFYIIFSTILLAYGFNNFQSMKEEHEKLLKVYEFTRKKQTLAKIADLDTGNGVPQDTFVLAVLEHLGVVDHENDVAPWIEKFKEIDADGSGAIDREEIEMFTERMANEATAQLQKSEVGRDVGFVDNLRLTFGFASTGTRPSEAVDASNAATGATGAGGAGDDDNNFRLKSSSGAPVVGDIAAASPMHTGTTTLRTSLLAAEVGPAAGDAPINGNPGNTSPINADDSTQSIDKVL